MDLGLEKALSLQDLYNEFYSLDTNNDGVLDRNEVNVFIRRIHKNSNIAANLLVQKFMEVFDANKDDTIQF